MKTTLKLISLFLAALIVFTLCGCGKKKTTIPDYEDEYFSIETEESSDTVSENTTSDDNKTTKDKALTGDNKQVGNGDLTDNGSEDNKSVGNEKTPDNSSENNNVSVNVDDYKKGSSFYKMSIPSRANAYKLVNTYSKLKSNQSVKVAYIGGSVTSGTGSSSESTKSWRAITTDYISSLTSGKVTEINAALGGTGSYLGAARFENKIISGNPDLLFIEFAINDHYNDLSDDQIKANLEYMIRSLYNKNPYADIVLTLVTNRDNLGRQYRTYTAHKAVADHYNIPIVDLGGELYNRNEGLVSKYFSDSVHPNDDGYKQYGVIMTDALKELFADGEYSKHTMPANRLFANGYNTLENVSLGSLIDGNWKLNSWFTDDNIEKATCRFRSSNLKDQYPNYIAPKSSGATLSYSFTGNSFGILGTVKDKSSVTVTIDGVKKVIVGTASQDVIEYPLFANLSNGPHTATITATRAFEETPQVAIAAFVVTK